MTGSLRGAPEFAALGQELRDLSKGREFAYFQISGNWGDSLIRKGARQFFENESLSARTCYARDRTRRVFSFKFPPRRRWEVDLAAIGDFTKGVKLAVVSGGGGWCPSFGSSRKLAINLLRYCQKVVVLPHSYALPPIEGEVVYYGRDVSYSRKLVGSARFCHDMAFYLSPSPREPMMEVGFFFRDDRESHYRLAQMAGNIDISRLDDELGDPDGFFDIVGRYRTVITDRLHVAIAGALLGRTTFVLDGSYWKLRSVYEASLKPNFPHVHYCSSLKDLPSQFRNCIGQ